MNENEAREAFGDSHVCALRRHSARPFVIDRPRRLGVAVSGGSDSMALLDLMFWHAREKDFEVCAITVDHGLRADAKDECAFVAGFCNAKGISHQVARWTGWVGVGNLQAKARKARYRLITDWATRQGVDWIALGHTLDDQAETVVMRLARQSGVDGLAGMPDSFERDGLRFIRPLLSQRRDDLRAYLDAQAVTWCEDPSNEDESYERVRARKSIATLTQLGIDAHGLSQVALHARSAKVALDHYVHREVTQNHLVKEDRGDLILPERTPTPEHTAPPEIHRRALNAAFLWVSGSEYPPRATSVVQMSAKMSETDRHTLGDVLQRG